MGIARWSGDSYTLSASSLRPAKRGSLSSALAVRAFCSFTQIMERAAATSSSHWYLSACSREENAGGSAAGVEEGQPVAPPTNPTIPLIPELTGPDLLPYPPKNTTFPFKVVHQ